MVGVNGYAAPRARALQPKEPLVQVREELELLQPEPASPAPKKLVVEARVAKNEVVVALAGASRGRPFPRIGNRDIDRADLGLSQTPVTE